MEIKPLVVSELNPLLNSHLVVDECSLSAVTNFLSSVSEFGFDLETNVTKTHTDRKIRTIQIGNRDEQYIIDLLAFAGSPANLQEGQGSYSPSAWARPVAEALRPFLESDEVLKVGTYLQFDYETLKWCLGIRAKHFYDCHLAEKILTAGLAAFWNDSLEDLTLKYCHLQIDKTLQTGFGLETPLTQNHIDYGALDVRLPFAIKAGQKPRLEKLGLMRVLNEIENPAIPAFGDIHLNGMKLCADKWMTIIDAVKIKHVDNIQTLDTFFIPVVGGSAKPSVACSIDEAAIPEEKLEARFRSFDSLDQIEAAWRDEDHKARRASLRELFYAARRKIAGWEKAKNKWEGQAAINYGSTDQLIAALRQMGFNESKLPDTNDRTLKKLKDPVIKALQEFRETAKLLTTYGESFLEYTDGITGRIHSKVNQMGAATGRTSSSEPNLQNIPKKPEWRACFIARPGYQIITIDMAGAELRILAEASGEPVWIEAFNKGWDVHSVGAEILFGQRWKDGTEDTCAYYHTGDHQKCKCKVHKDLRNKIKSINFGIAYGMEAGKLSEELGISKGEAQELLDLYRNTFRCVTAYLHKLGEFAKINLVAKTLSGRCRWFDRPDWNKARQKVIDDGKDPVQAQVSRKFHALYAGIEREGKNTPIQGTNADIAKLWMALIAEEIEKQFGGFLIIMVHDELVIECPEQGPQDWPKDSLGNVERCATLVASKCKEAGARLMTRVVMESEYHVAPYWFKD